MVNMLQPYLTGGIFLVLLKGCASFVRSSPEWSGFLGRSLSVVCAYDGYWKNYKKYWCKGSSWNLCETVVETIGSEAERKNGRTSIKDNQILSEFTVRLDNLTPQDAGIYWCAIKKTGSDPGFPVNITVLPEPTTTAAITTRYISTVPSPFPTVHPSSSLPMITVLLPLMVLLLVVFLVGALVVMCRLKKQKAGKASRVIPLTMAPSSTRGHVRRAAAEPKARPPFQTAPHCSNQAANTSDVEYSSVIAKPALNSQSQVPIEGVSYATLRFLTQQEETVYANV